MKRRRSRSEPQKILGDLDGNGIRPLPFTISASCNRVPSIDGHLVQMSVEFERRPEREEILEALAAFSGVPQERNLPSAPKRVIHLHGGPGPAAAAGRTPAWRRGMATSVGRLRECNLLHWKFAALSHNVLRGAAGAAVLNAELMRSEGFL